MKVVLTGAAGQLGQALIQSCPPLLKGEPLQLIACSRSQLDLADAEACRRLVLEHRPDWLINAGAYTAVDKAEAEPQLAQAVNAAAPQAFAEALQTSGGSLLQLSTDFVFNGRQGSPYQPEQAPDPLGVYGVSKAAGERAALQLPGARVLRTSWVYGPVGRNFCLTMLRLHRERAVSQQPLGVVADQVGCPTATHTLAAACWRALTLDPESPRILHWSDAGAASWYDFAIAIGDLAVELGLLEQAAPVLPLTTAQYPTPARRPGYSLLDGVASRAALQLEPQHWCHALRAVLTGIASASAAKAR